MSQKNKKNQIIMKHLNQSLLHIENQILNMPHHQPEDNQLVIQNYQLKVHKDRHHKINMCQSNHQLSKIEDFPYSKIMKLKDTLHMIKDQSNSLLHTWNKIHLINKDMMSLTSQFKLHNTHKT